SWGVTPQETVILEWDTFSEAADEAGISRLYGGIHFDDGDLNGRELGREVGESVWERTQSVIAPNVVIGTNDDDDLIGTSENNLMYGNRGDDIIQGLDGNDLLHGGKGDDTVDGGIGDDIIGGQMGDDILTGGAGGDMFEFGFGYGDDTIADFEDGIDMIGLKGGLSFEQLSISQIGNDTRISGDRLSIILQGVEISAIDIDDFMEMV
ncbi:MAG: calcium-binding protein, partial [Okeania sp. SIO3C4]|nr:calcium-binding protein [Okeania sp. SIO3C4]